VEKDKLVNFIKRYNIGGIVNTVRITNSNNTLSTKFIGEDRSVLGQVNSYDFKLAKGAFGIYDTDQFLKMLGVLDSDIEVQAVGENENFTKLVLSDSKIKANFLLCDLSIVPDVPDIKQLEFGLSFNLTSEFCNSFIKSYSALTDNEFFTVATLSSDQVAIIIGPHNNYSMNLKITIEVSEIEDFLMDTVTFRASTFKDIILANRDFENSKIEISEQGLAKVVFNKSSDYDSVYYLVAEQQSD